MSDETKLVMVGMIAIAVALFMAGILAMCCIAKIISTKDDADALHLTGDGYVLDIIFFDRNETRMRLEHVREHSFHAGILVVVYASGKLAYIPIDSVKYIRVLPYLEIDRRDGISVD